MKAVALTIAGSDSGGGAGIQADLKTFAALGVFGTSAITALTAQNTLGVDAMEISTPQIVYAQIKSVATDFQIGALKTGMLANAAIIREVARAIADFRLENLVVDTVMVSKSGHRLLEDEAADTLKKNLLPQALIITPNLPEAEALTGKKIANVDGMYKAAEDLYALGPRYVLVKGGHLSGETSPDIFYDGKNFSVFDAPRVVTRATHGTGCTLSAAITAYLALGFTPAEACQRAKAYLTEALRRSEPLGHGHAPLDHFWRFNSGSESRT